MSLPRGRAPHYALAEAVRVLAWNNDEISLPQGAFVRPIEDRYVPKHILEDRNLRRAPDETYCYTRFGIILIRTKLIREGV